MKKNDYIIVRTESAGVFAGHFESSKDESIILTDARRLWFWKGAASLSQLAMEGVKFPDECKFPTPVIRVHLFGVVEILEVTDNAQKIIKEVPIWEAKTLDQEQEAHQGQDQ